MSNSADNFLVYNLLKDSVKRWPERMAIHDEYGSLSYQGLDKEVETLKNSLSEIGVAPGICVGVKARNGRDFIISVFAVLGCGAAVMPVSHQLKKPELEEILAVAGLHFLIEDGSGERVFDNVDATYQTATGTLDITSTQVSTSKVFAEHVNAPAFIRYTSGTTGTSKGVVIGNKSVHERTAAANKGLHLNENSNVVWVLPMAYHFVVSIVLYVRVGAAITITPNFMARSVIEMTNKYKGTLLYSSPMQIKLLAADRGEDGLESLEKVISTSAGIHSDVSEAFYKRFNKVVHQAFGIIEIGLPMINTEAGEEFLDAVGYVLPDYDVKTFDEDGNRLPEREKGMLGIKGPGMFDAYLDPPTLREELLNDGYFLTADYASVDENGLVRIEGRKKSMINISGNKVFAEEVENVLQQLPYIELSRVSGVPHPLMGQIIQAELVLNQKIELDVEAILKHCRERLSTFKIPQKVVVVEELPMTDSGKVKR